MSFQEFMKEEKQVSRWFVTSVFIAGAFAGALLAVAFSLTAFV